MMENEKKHCGQCAFFCDEDDGSAPYCLLEELYTEVGFEDDACDDFRQKPIGKK